MSKQAFRIQEPSGKAYIIFEDGAISGFEKGAIICNFAAVKLDFIHGELIQALNNGLLTREKLAEIFS